MFVLVRMVGRSADWIFFPFLGFVSAESILTAEANEQQNDDESGLYCSGSERRIASAVDELTATAPTAAASTCCRLFNSRATSVLGRTCCAAAAFSSTNR